ncbi:hypothetical protein [Baekduia sp. Peel2402]|uniref:hypothetical protein n=1 Tax=Baekduia sp. Peel2402 TaxID=3458296 RepID=UPI00403EED34
MSDIGLPGDPRPPSRWRRALVYFGLAEDDPVNPLYPRPARTATAAAPSVSDPDPLARIERRLDEQAAAIAELRAEVERLRERDGV